MDRTRKHFLRLKAIYYTHCFASLVFFFPHFSVYLRYNSLAQHVRAFFFFKSHFIATWCGNTLVYVTSSLLMNVWVASSCVLLQLVQPGRALYMHQFVFLSGLGSIIMGPLGQAKHPSMFIVRVVEKRYFHMKLDGQRRSSSILVFVPRRLGQVLWRLTHMVAYLLTYGLAWGKIQTYNCPTSPCIIIQFLQFLGLADVQLSEKDTTFGEIPSSSRLEVVRAGISFGLSHGFQLMFMHGLSLCSLIFYLSMLPD